tara:strand:+ start:569 stop:1999 length:1431 start_codon:yes stop_codon:yes gene_type:complete
MRSSYRWREHLLGSLHGQLQLATYLVVFVGFTGASSVGLFLGQRNMFANEHLVARASIEESDNVIQNFTGDRAALQKELLFHSGNKNQLWVEYENGELIYPEVQGAPGEDLISIAMASNPSKQVGLQSFIEINDSQHIVELLKEFPNGTRLWTISETESSLKALSNYLALMILVWGSCLAITLLAVSWVVRKIVKPLDELNLATADLNAENLSNKYLQLDHAPSEVILLQDTFNSLVERLALSWSRQRQFAAVISHEFRTPMTVISGFIQSVLNRSQGKLDSQQRKSLEIANSEVLRLNRMLSDLLDLSRADNQQLSIRREPFGLIPNLEQSLKLAQAAYSNPISNNIDDLPCLEARGDSDRLIQCIGNLIGNAVKYSDDDAPIDLYVTYDDLQVVISIVDRGQGIPDDQQERIFERFTHAEGVVLPPGQSSTGLGLSIVKMLVERMGGSIKISSKVGEGSSFSLHLPLVIHDNPK